jgi:ubiquinone/menaquinone biosynthesis C-methylase UbiE
MSPPDREVYTHSHRPDVLAAHARRTVEEAAAFLLPHLEPGMEVLDLGCGPGSITVGLARYVSPSLVVGVDRATAALGHAQALAADEHLDNVRFELADVYALPFADDSFDVVYAHQLLQHLADPVGALREAARVLRPGGYVAVRDADYGTMTHHPHDRTIDRWLAVYQAVARANGGEPDAGRRLLEWVLAAGFEHVHAGASSWVFASDADRRWWVDLWAGRNDPSPPGSDGLVPFALRVEELGVATRDDLTAFGAAFRTWADEPTGWFAFIHGEVLASKRS